MTLLIVIILSIIQGAAEFLPISSSGHLVIAYRIFNVTGNTVLLSVILHIATLFSVIIIYRKRLYELIKHPFCKTNWCIVITTIITIIMVLFFKKSIESSFSGEYLYICFIITAVMLFVADNFNFWKSKKVIDNKPINFFQATIVGVAQGIACFPGISRSGSTISSGLIVGIDKNKVADYSFIISIPIIIASLILEIVEYVKSPSIIAFNFFELAVGFIVAFIVGLLCIKLLIKFVKNKNLTIFSFYLLILSIFLILNDNLLFLF